MPHIVAEYSRDIPDFQPDQLVRDLHNSLAGQETVKRSAIKTRAIPLTDFMVGDVDDPETMVHITLRLLPGRALELKQKMITALRDVAAQHAPHSKITAEIVKLEKETYCG